jgi:hypothetical protein
MSSKPTPARHIFEHLISLHERWSHSPTEAGPEKRRYAAEAAFFSGLLIEQVAGWALEHLASSYEAEFLRSLGGKAEDSASEEIGNAARRAGFGKLLALGGVVPKVYKQDLLFALQALNVGEVRPLLAPTATGKWGQPYSLAQYQFLAVQHVFYEWGRGSTKKVAIKVVAEAMGVSDAALRTWETSSVPSVFEDARDLYKIAKRAGALSRGSTLDPKLDGPAAAMLDLLKAQPIEKVATEYLALKSKGRD